MKKVLIVIAVNHDYIEFAIPQLKTMLRKMNVPLKQLFRLQINQNQYPQHEYQITYKSFKNYPFIQLEVPDFENHREYLSRAAKNSIMISKIILMISEGKTYQQLFQNRNEELLEKECRNWDDQIYCDFSSRNRSINRAQQIVKITELLGKWDIRGKININQPNKILAVVEDHIWFLKHHQQPSQTTLQYVYFGLELSSFRNLKGLKFNIQYQLPNRIYLGPTSTDNDLAFLMCHQGNVEKYSYVLDPFVGTASLLIPPAYYQAFTFGSDLDIRVLNGYAVGQINKKSKYYKKQSQLEIFTPKILLNFKQYNLSPPQLFRMDCLTSNFRQKQFFDSIICDPPYGLRAMSRTVNPQTKQQQKQEQIEQVIEQIKQLQISQQKQTKLIQKQEQQSNIKQIQKEQQQQQEQIGNDQKIKNEQVVIGQNLQDQKLKKQKKKQMRKQNKKKRKEKVTEEEKQFKQKVLNKYKAERKGKNIVHPKIQTTAKKDIYEGLLDFANQYLKKQGYLVYLYPIMVQQNYQGKPEQLPSHPNFELIDYSVNKLAKGNIRVLVTMRKK